MNPWQLIFLQSRANNGAYDGDSLPAQNWDWPQGTWFQERLRYLRKTQQHVFQRINSEDEARKTNSGRSFPSTKSPARAALENKTTTKKEGFSVSLSVVPLLLTGESVSPEARNALRENRLKDAAVILMEEYGLSCTETSDLLDVSAC